MPTVRRWPDPEGTLVKISESDCHLDEGDALVPNLVTGETPRLPKFDPNTETETEPEAGAAIGSMRETIGFEKEIRVRDATTRLACEAKTTSLPAGPAGDLHNVRESEIHNVVSQEVAFARISGEPSYALKFKPNEVRMALPDDGIAGPVLRTCMTL
jgi:hypothetical protein